MGVHGLTTRLAQVFQRFQTFSELKEYRVQHQLLDTVPLCEGVTSDSILVDALSFFFYHAGLLSLASPSPDVSIRKYGLPEFETFCSHICNILLELHKTTGGSIQCLLCFLLY
jgi:hypothetical protein